MLPKRLSVVASVGLTTLLCISSRASAQVSPSLGSAGTYSVLAGSQVTHTAAPTFSVIGGDVGISPGIGPSPHTTNFDRVVLGGTLHDADAAALNAQADKNTAYGALDQGCTVSFAGAFKELAGSALVPGVYCATSFHLTGGTLTLSGTAGDTWIFKSASDLIIAGTVVSPSCNVWWRVVSTATLDANSSLVGNMLADTSITLGPGAILFGRALARTAEVSLSANLINPCVAPVPTLPAWAMIGLSALLALAGFTAVRRRNA